MADLNRFDRCGVICIHEEAVAEVRQLMIDEEAAKSFSWLFPVG